MPRLTLKRAFELGAIAMKQLASAQCGNLTESLQEGMMTDGGLTAADKKAMTHQVNAIDEVERDIVRQSSRDAAYYGSYILPDAEKSQIKKLFGDDLPKRFGEGRAPSRPTEKPRES
jgi:hypothetical protein